MNACLALTAMMAVTGGGPSLVEASNAPAVCQDALNRCIFAQCDEIAVEKVCAFYALTPRASGIIRHEVRNARSLVRQSGDARACAAEFGQMWLAAEAQLANAPLRLDYGVYTSLDAAPEDERSTIYRAELDLALTGMLSEVQASGQWSCSISAHAPIVLLRAQNLAYAQDRELLRALDEVDGTPATAPAIWLIYLHADLWQVEQRDASAVFDALAAHGRFPERLARNLNARVRAHQPLYEDADLSAGWREEPD